MRATFIIVLACIAVFVLQVVSGALGFVICEDRVPYCPPDQRTDIVTAMFYLKPSEATSFAVWQFFTYMFLHADISHITINMFVFLIFGVPVEMRMKRKNFVALYLLAGVGSAVFHLIVSPIINPADWNIGLIGASGAVFGILTAYAFLYPKNIIWIFPGIPLPAVFAVAAIAGFELFSGIFGLEGNIANFGHLGGVIVGVIFMLWWRKYGKKKRFAFGDYEWFWQ